MKQVDFKFLIKPHIYLIIIKMNVNIVQQKSYNYLKKKKLKFKM